MRSRDHRLHERGQDLASLLLREASIGHEVLGGEVAGQFERLVEVGPEVGGCGFLGSDKRRGDVSGEGFGDGSEAAADAGDRRGAGPEGEVSEEDEEQEADDYSDLRVAKAVFAWPVAIWW
ncbi:hypothetical protein [Streptomyces parvus]|uniref:hypothetical protein n=1 Tax=Streptomyces parvus TaxID=66428 RepID=UPI003624D296